MFKFPEVSEEVINEINNCRTAVVFGHKNPDGDCLNSVISMGLLLKNLGKKVIMTNAGKFERPEIQSTMEYLTLPLPKDFIKNDTLMVVVDCSSPERVGELEELLNNHRILVIDHHQSGSSFGNSKYIVPQSPSTTLLIQKLYKTFDINITNQIAKFIFRGFATDSGFFRFLKDDSGETLRMISELVDAGVAPHDIYNDIHSGRNIDSVYFLSALINRAESRFNGKLYFSHEEESDAEQFGPNARSSDDFYAQFLTIKNVEVVLVFKVGSTPGTIEIGFRASHKSNVNVGIIAETLGGGGHAKAAGASVKGSYNDVKKLVISKFSSYLS